MSTPPPPNDNRPARTNGAAPLGATTRSKKRSVVRYPTVGNALRAHLEEVRRGGSSSAVIELRRDNREKKSGKVPASRLLAPVIKQAPVRRLVLRPRSAGFPAKITVLGSSSGKASGSPAITAERLGRDARLRRQSLGLTQSQLATRAGVGRRFIVELERGKPTLEIGKVLTVVQALGLVLTAQIADAH